MKHVQEKLPAWAAGELDAAEHAAVESHLETCDACRREAAATRELWLRLDEARVGPQGPSAWPAIRARTVGRRQTAWFFGDGPLARAGWAAATVAAGLAVSLLLPGSMTTSPAVAADDDSLLAGLWLEDTSLETADAQGRLSALWLDAAGDVEDDGS